MIFAGHGRPTAPLRRAGRLKSLVEPVLCNRVKTDAVEDIVGHGFAINSKARSFSIFPRCCSSLGGQLQLLTRVDGSIRCEVVVVSQLIDCKPISTADAIQRFSGLDHMNTGC